MRKNDLIKLLNNIPGNPEVILWNGYVEDYQPINTTIHQTELVKHSKKFLATCLQREGVEPSIERVNSMFNAQQWEFPNEFTTEKERETWYGKHRRRVAVISGGKRNKQTYDRLGKISY